MTHAFRLPTHASEAARPPDLGAQTCVSAAGAPARPPRWPLVGLAAGGVLAAAWTAFLASSLFSAAWDLVW
jgi:hypothetical protein